MVKQTGALRVWSVTNIAYKTRKKTTNSTEFCDYRRSIPYTLTELSNINTR